MAAVVFGAAALAPALATAAPDAAEKRAKELEQRLGGGVEASPHSATNRVRFVGTAPGRPISRPAGVPPSAPPQSAARAFLDLYGDSFGVRDQARELKVEEVADAPRGRSSVRFQQRLDGVPVLGGELVVNLDRRGNVLSASGEVLPGRARSTEPSVSTADATGTALDAVSKAYDVAAASLRASTPELWIYDSRLLGGPGLEQPLLTWRLEVTAPGRPIRELVLIDAELGSVVLSFNQIANARDREVCDAANADAEYPCTVGASDRSEGDSATGNQHVDNAYDFTGDAYDFFSTRFGRDSLDNAGMTLFSTVRYCPTGEPCPYDNAFWDGSQMVYGQGWRWTTWLGTS